ncbi:hypothetical protein RIF23_03200 [Lipingzhangella sp. LS1_29]|uniref:BON domain-containing protein n=1 Tax=Lipingzhangella rawalii TaxID=2055835 RepID=A0ABU2H3A9_9ACTN|nr:hypothetical protein [Lipingzhangella rawalii]MDS1269300.1 hypothetical protein [Lipingzhangella rawalii]
MRATEPSLASTTSQERRATPRATHQLTLHLTAPLEPRHRRQLTAIQPVFSVRVSETDATTLHITGTVAMLPMVHAVLASTDRAVCALDLVVLWTAPARAPTHPGRMCERDARGQNGW